MLSVICYELRVLFFVISEANIVLAQPSTKDSILFLRKMCTFSNIYYCINSGSNAALQCYARHIGHIGYYSFFMLLYKIATCIVLSRLFK